MQRNAVISTGWGGLTAGMGGVRSPVTLPDQESQPALQNSLVPRQAPKVAQLGVGVGAKPGPPGKAVPSHHRQHQGGSNPQS